MKSSIQIESEIPKLSFVSLHTKTTILVTIFNR